MKKVILGIVLATIFAAGVIFGQELSASEIMKEADRVFTPPMAYSKVKLTTIEPGKQDREMVIESYYKEGVGTFMEILSPRRSKGTRFLQRGDDLRMFSPRSNTRESIRLSAKESFQGSALSNNDISDRDYSDNYNTEIVKIQTVDHDDLGSVECYIIEGIAKDASAAYGKILMWVTVQGSIPLKIEYYARSGMLFRVMDLSGIKQLGGRRRPSRMRVESMDEEGKYSIMEIEELEIKDNLADNIFTKSYLERRR